MTAGRRDKRIWIVEFKAFDATTGLTKTEYFASGAGYTTPGDASAYPMPHTNVAPRIARLPQVQWEREADSGLVRLSGNLELDNTDGALDYLLSYSMHGRRLRLFFIEPHQSYITATESNLGLIAYMLEPETRPGAVVLRFAMGFGDENRQLLHSKLAGTGDMEGDSGLAGRLRPILYGKCRNVAPVLLGATKNIYLVSGPMPAWTGPLPIGFTGSTSVVHSDVVSVWDGGSPITKDVDYVSTTDLLNNAPAPGTYRVLKMANTETGVLAFRLGTKPTYEVTCDAELLPHFSGSALLANYRNLLKWIIGLANPEATLAANLVMDVPVVSENASVGIFIHEQRTVGDVLAELMQVIGGWIAFRIPRNLSASEQIFSPRFLQNTSSASTSIPYYTASGASPLPPASINGAQIESMELLPARDRTLTLPVWRVRVGYKRCWTVQRGNLAGIASDDYRSFVSQEARYSASEETVTRDNYPLAQEITRPAIMDDSDRASTEAGSQRLVFNRPRTLYEVRVFGLDPVNAMRITVGDKITIVGYPRHGCTTSRDFLVLGLEIDFSTQSAVFLLWS